MSLYPFDYRDTELDVTIIPDLAVEVSVHVIGGDLETDVIDVRCDGKSMLDGTAETMKIAALVKAQALAELDGGRLWAKVKDDYCLSFNDERGWRAA